MPRFMPVTQKQIADQLGLSQPIVAQALGGHPGVAAATRQRVEDAARELGYDAFSNGSARSLAARRFGKRAKTGTLAILMGDYFEGMALEQVPFFRELLEGFHAGAKEQDVELSLCLQAPTPLNVPRTVLHGEMDGALCVYRADMSALLRSHTLPIPVLRVGDAAPGEFAVLADDRSGILQATRHLIELGHTRIAYVGDLRLDSPNVSYQERLAGYHCALEEAGLPFDAALVVSDIGEPTKRAGAWGFDTLRGRGVKFSAAVCFNDQSALGFIGRAQGCGLRVPRDLSATGFDGGSEGLPSGDRLTSASFDRIEMGRRAIELLCEAVNHDGQPRPTCIVPTQLRVGHTTKVL